MEPQIKRVKIEKLTEEAFEPFGDILGPKDRPPDWKSGAGPPTWFPNFSVDGTVKVAYASYTYEKPPTEYVFHVLEQHRSVTQSAIPLEGKPCILTVAPPTDWRTKPDVDKIRAFLLDGTRGVVLGKLTWHNHDAPMVLPMYPPTFNIITIHEAETYQDIANKSFEFTYEVDIKEHFNAVIQLTW